MIKSEIIINLIFEKYYLKDFILIFKVKLKKWTP